MDPAIKKRELAKIKGGADNTPTLVATEADAQRIENIKPINIFFTLAKLKILLVRLVKIEH